MPGMYVYRMYENGEMMYSGDANTEIYQLYLVDTGNEIQLSWNYRESGPWDENVVYTFSYTDNYSIDYYTSVDRENWVLDTSNTDIDYINHDIFSEPLHTNIRLDFHDITDPGPEPEPRPDKTKIGGSSIRLKKIGNATVVKEVLNGVVIYTAE